MTQNNGEFNRNGSSFDMTPRQPKRPLNWSDALLDLSDMLKQMPLKNDVYIVGGAVRDAYLGYPIKDIDLVTPSGAIKLARKLADALHGDVFVMDAERDVARVLATRPDGRDRPDGRLHIDLASFRAEDLLADLLDRDFTINAMAVDLRGDLSLLIDPLNGEADLVTRVMRRCTPDSIANDPIRALRAVRQSVQLYARIEPETLRDIRQYAPTLTTSTSPERVRDEFFKVLGSGRPAAALRVASALGLLDEILPEIAALKSQGTWEAALITLEKLGKITATISPSRTDETAATFEMGMVAAGLDRFRKPLQQHLDYGWPNERPHSTLLTLSALLLWSAPSSGQSAASYAATIAETLRLSNGERGRLALILRDPSPSNTLIEADITPLYAHRFWRSLGEAGIDVCLSGLAHYLGKAGAALVQDVWLRLIEKTVTLLEMYILRHDEIVAPPVLLDGAALQQKFNLTPGPLIGALLEAIREAQVVGAVVTEDDALRVAQAYIDRQG